MIAVDTEFVWTKTYFPILGIIQIGVSKEHSFIVDCLTITNTEPLKTLLENSSIIKIFHDAHQDITIINRYTGGKVVNVFDTQLAASFAGLGPSLSLEKLIRAIAKVSLSKSETRTDWVKRPLTEKQLDYALDDVRYLVFSAEELIKIVTQNGTDKWMFEEMANKYRTILPFPFEEAVIKIFSKNANRVPPKYYGKVYHIIKFIETTARKRDIPRDHVINKDKISQLAKLRASSIDGLERSNILSPKGFKRYGKELFDIITSNNPLPDDIPTNRRKHSNDNGDALTLSAILSGLIHSVSSSYQIDPSIIMNKSEIVTFSQNYIKDNSNCTISGWRGEMLNRPIAEFLAGDLYMRYNNKKTALEVVKSEG